MGTIVMATKIIAIILSGGSGSRFGGSLPKQFVKLAGKSVIEYTIQTFEDNHHIDEIIIVTKEKFADHIWEIVQKNHWKKIIKVINGGKERFDSTLSALFALKDYPSDTKVLFHDAVRPLVSQRIINDCIEKLEYFDAIDVVIPTADTIVEVFDDGSIANIPERSRMRRGQTPQGFRLQTIRSAYDLAIQHKRTIFTCDCGVVRAMLPHIKVACVLGDEKNLKITHHLDLFIAEKQLQISNRENIKEDTDLRQLHNKVIVIFGGSSGIGKAMAEMALLQGAKVYIASRSHNGVDITQKSHIKNFLESVYLKEQQIDYVVNTAGVLIKKPIDLLSDEEMVSLVDINYTGCIYVAMLSKHYLAKSRGMLLNFTSSSYTRGRAFYAIYSSSNAAIVNLTQALADEWNALGIKVNCINPERTSTPMRTKNFGKENPKSLLAAEDVAQIGLYTLISQHTGIIVDVRKDGR